ncbi:MAG: flagellin lysine-N-methylase [Gammaproteobacteria bacterium]|nr:flagellin lysine-N-methylase [Gammaproteobacteria bacterium]MBU1416524.1 flagellin lysine-N-methylase [Gammaproteobacteria bacterium]
MAKKRPAKGSRAVKQSVVREQVVQPDYYAKFRCIGGECEDSCCRFAWRVDIDRATWQRYQACQSETLKPLLQEFIQPEPSPDLRRLGKFATVKFLPNQDCPFLNADMLCMIHKELGEEALCNTCAAYPRVVNRFGQQGEYGLAVSCPEAARVALLHPEPTVLVVGDVDGALARRGIMNFTVDGGARNVSVMNQLRVLILRVLQWRNVSLGARMMLLGSLLNEVSPSQGGPRFRDAAGMTSVLDTYATLFADPGYVEAEFEQLPGNLPRKLQYTTGFLADFLTGATPRFQECLTAFASGLLNGNANETAGSMAALMAHYERIYDDFYLPYFREKSYVLENYLVNEVLYGLFPFVRGSVIELYRAMVFNLAIIQVMLVGIAGHYKGLTDERAIQFIQSFARRSAHNDSYIRELTEAIASKDEPSFVEVMWMLKER